MEYRLLGRSGLKVSTLTMGTMTFGGKGRSPRSAPSGSTRRGGRSTCASTPASTCIDTANVYSGGVSEEIIGEALGGKRKGDVLIATKARFRMGKGPNDEGLSRHHLIRACEASLKRLRTDVIDLYYLHEWDGATPLEETMAALDTLVSQGKVRYVGCSNYLRLAHHEGARHQRPRAAAALRHPADPLHAGGARGRIRAGADLDRPGARRSGLEPARRRPAVRQASPRPGDARGHAPARRLDASRRSATRSGCGTSSMCWSRSATARGVSAAQVALAWLLGRPGVTSLVIGGRNEAQFKDNLAAADLKLSDEERARLDAVSRPPVLYPYWHQQCTARDRFGAADKVLDRTG